MLRWLALFGCVEGAPDDVVPDGTPVVPPSAVWTPAPGTPWQIQLSGAVDTRVDVAMYDVDGVDTPDAVIADLHASGRIVSCYFSAGSWEDWRSDADAFPAAAIGRRLDGWPGERWLDVRDPTVRELLVARIDEAAERGCDAVDPDNVDGFSNATGFDLTYADQIDFNRFLADTAHARGLSVGLKNDLDQLEDLVDWFDWALNEQCAAYDECDRLAVFTGAGKAVFNVEYVDDMADAEALAADVCGAGPDLDTLIKTLDLGPERYACP